MVSLPENFHILIAGRLHPQMNVVVDESGKKPVPCGIGVEAAAVGTGLRHAGGGAFVLDFGSAEATAAVVAFEKCLSSKHIVIVLFDLRMQKYEKKHR